MTRPNLSSNFPDTRPPIVHCQGSMIDFRQEQATKEGDTMRNIRYAPNSAALGVVSNAQRRAKRAAAAERRGHGIPASVQVIIAVASVIIALFII